MIGKPRDLRLKHVCFPRLPALKPRADDVLALPLGLGAMLDGPRKILEGRNGKGARGSRGAILARCPPSVWPIINPTGWASMPPATELARHAKVPVSVFWHWWHDCAYDAAFPDYLPPREGEASFTAALDLAHRHGLHVLPYMNQRLWGMTTRSWTAEGAEASAVKGPDGKVHPEHCNTFMTAPCAVMCLGTDFWRSKYAGMAHQVISRLKADGILCSKFKHCPPL